MEGRSTLVMDHRMCREVPALKVLQQPLRVGVWLIWQVGSLRGTILPKDGIGVYTHQLIRSLLDLDEPIELVVLALGSDRDFLEQSLGGSERLQIITVSAPNGPLGFRLLSLLNRGLGVLESMARTAMGWVRTRKCVGAARLKSTAMAFLRNPQFPRVLRLSLALYLYFAWWLGRFIVRMSSTGLRVLLAPVSAFGNYNRESVKAFLLLWVRMIPGPSRSRRPPWGPVVMFGSFPPATSVFPPG